MLAKVDIIGKIQQLYMERRPVPYLAFMYVFNGLLADVRQVVPRAPSEALKERMRAACMALNVGLIDSEGREQARLREFRERILPAWKAKLPPGEFAKFEEILQGGLRERHRQEAIERAKAATQQTDDRGRQLMEKLGIAALEKKTETVQVAAVELPDRLRGTRRFAAVQELCRAIRSGGLRVDYAPRGEAEEFARYSLDSFEVTVTLAEADGHHYTVLRANMGRASVPDAEERVDTAAAELRYLRMADYAYMRSDGQSVYTLKVGPDTLSVACAGSGRVGETGSEDVARRIELLHQDLGELVRRLSS